MPSSDLERRCVEYEKALAALSKTPRIELPQCFCSPATAEVLAAIVAIPSQDELTWLLASLRHPQRRWFVASGLKMAESIDDRLFLPIMRIAMETVYSDAFVNPCVRVFGLDQVEAFFAPFLASGAESEKCSAECGRYFAIGEHQALGRHLNDPARLPL